MNLFKLLDNKLAGAATLLFCAFSVVYIAYANVDHVEKARSELEDIKMEQEYLKELNDGLRQKEESFEASLKAVREEIIINKQEWSKLQGNSEIYRELIESAEAVDALQGLD